MFRRLSEDGRKFESQTKDHIKKYAEAGLRIMVIAYRELGVDEYKSWEEDFLKAKTSVVAERDELVEAVADRIERNLTLLGATAVEDKLQKGVCIEKLKFRYLNFRLCFRYKFKPSLLSHCISVYQMEVNNH